MIPKMLFVGIGNGREVFCWLNILAWLTEEPECRYWYWQQKWWECIANEQWAWEQLLLMVMSFCVSLLFLNELCILCRIGRTAVLYHSLFSIPSYLLLKSITETSVDAEFNSTRQKMQCYAKLPLIWGWVLQVDYYTCQEATKYE